MKLVTFALLSLMVAMAQNAAKPPVPPPPAPAQAQAAPAAPAPEKPAIKIPVMPDKEKLAVRNWQLQMQFDGQNLTNSIQAGYKAAGASVDEFDFDLTSLQFFPKPPVAAAPKTPAPAPTPTPTPAPPMPKPEAKKK